ncbi:hypothetical protein BUH_4451 [Burkholderia pseudomallei Pakistan 9]|nr:hypothetical protein BUH_4451 [Burkholderia pseudomallei Pakistan 9]
MSRELSMGGRRNRRCASEGGGVSLHRHMSRVPGGKTKPGQ